MRMAVKFKLLLWKNCLTEKRMWPFFLAELCAIILIGVLIIANPSRNLRRFTPTEDERKSVRIHPTGSLTDLSIIRSMIEIEDLPKKLVYRPETAFAKKLAETVAKNLSLTATSDYVPKETFAVVTMGDHSDNGLPPANLTLSIRFPGFFRTIHSSRYESRMWLTRCTGALINDLDDADNYTQVDLYIREGFLQLEELFFEQWFLELMNIAKTNTDKSENSSYAFKLQTHSFRYDTNQMMCQPTQTTNVLSLLYHFLFFLPFINLVWKYGREREENILAHHWRYGCGKLKYWLAHFVSSFFHFLLLGCVVLILTYISWQTKPESNYKNHLDVLYLFLVLLLAITELIITAILIVSLVVNAKSAVYLSILVWILLYAIFSVVLEYSYEIPDEIESAWIIFALVAFFNNSFVYGMRYMVDLTEGAVEKLPYLYGAMLLSILFKMLLLSIVHHFMPGRYMNRLPYPFCGLRQLCNNCSRCPCNCEKVRTTKSRESKIDRDNYQFGPIYGEKILIATKVAKSMKTFASPARDVVKKVSLTVYKGEITVLLGHNGCGKTTLISLFAGWRKPDEGSIFIDNYNMGEFPSIKKKVDVSMPNNALFDYLTASETLRYFMRIKGRNLRIEQFQEEMKIWLKTLKAVLTTDEANKKLVHQLSFEQKRLLSLCCVLSCGTRIVLLDEPTLHMRTAEQRLYWSILQREKLERAIIVATYSFREAETIGDRIAVLTDGALKAYGTPMFLKTTFGKGFDLIILKEKESPSDPITNMIQEYIPDITPHIETQDQLVYKISSDKRSKFQTMLIYLHKNRSELGITDARLLTTDLSEVYMSLGRIKNRQSIPDDPKILSIEYVPKKRRIKLQWKAMFFKKFTHQPSIVIPFVMCVISLLIIFTIYEMLGVLRSRPANPRAMTLGYAPDVKERGLSHLKNCKFIGIKSVQVGSSILRERNHSYTFTKDSFFCSQSMDFTDYIYLNKEKDMNHLYGALSIKHEQYDIYINQHIFHSAPLILNLFQNYLLEKHLPLKKEAISRVILDPSQIPTPLSSGLLDSELEHLYLPLTIGIILPLTISTFVLALAQERNENIIIMMAIAGLRVDIYWLVNLFWDWVTYLIYTILFQIVILITFYSELGLVNSWFIFFLSNIYSIPTLGSIYFISMFRFFSQRRAYLITCLVHVVSGLFAFVIYWDVFLAQSWFGYILLFSPTFALLDGVSGVYVLSKFKLNCENRCNELEICETNDICKTLPECCEYTFFRWGNSGIIRALIYLIATTVIVVFLMCWVEIHRRENKFYMDSKVKKMYTKTFPYDDDDIVQMRDKIARAELRTITRQRLVVDQVEGSIPSKQVKYLTTVSFEAERKSVLAIYGTQHVGKSHLCRQIVGEDSFRFGDIYIRGIPVKYNMHDAWVYLGYCPQMYGAFKGFTPIEVFHFFCMLRGVPSKNIPMLVHELSNIFGLGNSMRTSIARLSRGTQRKVVIATAFLVNNKVIVLDEPTRGLPQWVRREIWDALIYMRSCGKTIVITTTDMYECDALADQVLLIDDGEMLAYGGPHYLRHKHVVGFYLEVKLRRDGQTVEEMEENLRLDVENLHRFMIFLHSESVMLNRVDNCLKFYLPVEKVNFNLLYGSLEKNRVRLNISEYTVSQGNFEEVLSNISKKREHKQALLLK